MIVTILNILSLKLIGIKHITEIPNVGDIIDFMNMKYKVKEVRDKTLFVTKF